MLAAVQQTASAAPAKIPPKRARRVLPATVTSSGLFTQPWNRSNWTSAPAPGPVPSQAAAPAAVTASPAAVQPGPALAPQPAAACALTTQPSDPIAGNQAHSFSAALHAAELHRTLKFLHLRFFCFLRCVITAGGRVRSLSHAGGRSAAAQRRESAHCLPAGCCSMSAT
jgi:hypothetical protein